MRSFTFNKRAHTVYRTKSMQILLQELKKYPPLSKEDEYALFDEYRAGSEAAKEKLIKHNLRFVVTAASNYVTNAEDMEDTYAQGVFGLIEAVEGYDHTRGFKFISFAVWHINCYIFDSFRTSKVVKQRRMRPPENKALKMLREEKHTDEAITKACGIPMATLKRIKTCKVNISSIDVAIPDMETTIADNMMCGDPLPDASIISEYESIELHKAISKLEEREKIIIKMSFGFDLGMPATLDSIAEVLGLSRERIRQLMPRILNKLRIHLSQTQN
jgi:RNA polymerase primary sigma factor